ncbi:MAG: amidase [Alphaproteobacteria bacterium]|jgi:aspartyl-tRNA(Asn)/glutamyl-tRNA(Gln) amidotransferase subunit A|nr:amidase [Rhodospirillaceae bacterium]MDP6023058.1 amidase [Alphaproteobacteria bacterium]MDP6253820.1 amidase [Alphaproteobacteria bacterium]MDP7053244.1 amidase [Alphaproteobacteria bacterium]MDP7228477.1 amidase [Alphaproteobacteria bacterium]|tara:strand:- start:1236 stop:2585 length:1350 start_codon:yes stop_codon:yes gene_type:complete
MKSLADIAGDLAAGRASSQDLTEAALARIDDGAGEGARAFIKVYHEAALECAKASDQARAHGIVASPLAGIPVSIKDLCDVAGEVTLAGSIVRRDEAPATKDAPAVVRLRAAGAVITGRTNMVEFAMGAPGTNAHYGTPKNAWDRATGRIPGGSSSGAAVSVTDGMAAAALGTDTAGSVRIPAALCGLVGLKPTARRVPTEGIYPLSRTLDSVGPLAPTVACCALVDAVFAGETPPELAPRPLQGLRLAVPKYLVFDDVDDAVAAAFQGALSKLSAAGARITNIDFAELARIPAINRIGGFSTAEAYTLHRAVLDRAGNQYDQNVAARIRSGEVWTAADYIDLIDIRADMMAAADRITAPFDAIVMPTLPVIACAIADVEDGEAWGTMGRLLLRNTLVSNFLDRCALTVPCHDKGDAPVGFTMIGETMGDRRLLEIGLAVEACISPALS